jgi:hypothetical protein
MQPLHPSEIPAIIAPIKNGRLSQSAPGQLGSTHRHNLLFQDILWLFLVSR